MSYFFNIWIKFFFLLTPFFTLSMFLSMTKDYDEIERRKVAYKVTQAIIITCFFLYFFGDTIFQVFGITLDSFRIGAGSLLFLSAVTLVHGDMNIPDQKSDKNIAFVPLAIPITVGPATTGAILVLGAEVHDSWHRLIGFCALTSAILCVGALMLLSSYVERLIGKNGFVILGKITGLVLAALASQITFTGIKNFLNL